MLTDAGHVNTLGTGQGRQAFDDVLGREERLVLRRRVTEGELVLPLRRRRVPGVVVAQLDVLERLRQVDDDLLGVPHDRHVGDTVLADLRRVDIRVDDLGERGEAVECAGDAVVEAGTDRDEQVRALQRRHGRHAAVHSRHTEVQLMAVREGAARHERRHDGDLRLLDEGAQFLVGTGTDDTAADVEHGTLGFADELGRSLDLLRVRLRHRAVARQIDRRRPGERRLRRQCVLRDVDEHGARSAGGSDVERLGDGARDVIGAGDEVVVLRDRHRDAADVRFLEGVRTDGLGVDLSGDGDDRHRVHVGIGQRSDQVRGARPRGRHAHAHLAGGRGVPLGGVAGALLVANEDVTNLDGVEQRVVRGEDGPARQAEDRLDTLRLEREDE